MTMNSDMLPSSRLVLGYDLDKWNGYGIKEPIEIDLSPQTNSHMILCGMSGAGKSFHEHQLLAKLAMAEPTGDIFFADYKFDDTFHYLRNCPKYFTFQDTIRALDIVHGHLLARQAGEDTSRTPLSSIFEKPSRPFSRRP